MPVRSYRMADLERALATVDFAVTVYTVPNCGRCDRVLAQIGQLDLARGFHLFRCLMDKRDAGRMFKIVGSLQLPIVSIHVDGERILICAYGDSRKFLDTLELTAKEKAANL